MASSLPLLKPEEAWDQWSPASLPHLVPYLITAFLVVAMMYSWSPSNVTVKNLPFVNPQTPWSLGFEAKGKFQRFAKDIIGRARAQFPNQPYRMVADAGEVIVLPPSIADEIRNESNLSFGGALEDDFHGKLPGFEPMGLGSSSHQILQVVARKQLTKSLSKVTEPLSEETALAVFINLGESTEWRELDPKKGTLDIIARISSRVFLGEQLCRDMAWLKITKEYTVNVFVAATKLRMYPKPLRKFAHWFLPECQLLRAQLKEARDVVAPIIEKRRRDRQAAAAAGKPVPRFNDALDWAEEEAAVKKATYEPAIFQMILSLAAIHTTSDLLTQAMLDLAEHPAYFQPLREEVAQVLRAEGWKKTSLYNMKLLDSFIKEVQRLKPISMVSMRRRVEGEVKLSNGIILKKGMRIMVDSYRYTDPTVHENPEQFDAYRFLKMRGQQGKENLAQLVSTSADHLGFGHGEHACPGRFFAANEIKVALCHLLMKYDWKLAPGSATKPVCRGVSVNTNPTAKLLIRRREQTELDVDSI